MFYILSHFCEQKVQQCCLLTTRSVKKDQRGKAFFRGARSGNALLTEATVRYNSGGEGGDDLDT